ncbi:UDP-N-acetylmuramoylalanine--D-glutamate ligase [Dethiosulfatibacter aminovorans DSM 17477]|uniref:UDP-N-acetylmuramoylalanine--D-glutamate ligase n=1 Tax=Dethiosulfatibacter aminovorans DSM 17477 TaxID=1121476 RepID=A0A1M6DLB0_9FIRM|nr:UDP-N-acetylmuramoyl-L-alanine--D-glutamate ligase [Dethiosulfatibacter aminovorans]SHI73982.1 UDP-N-acetylmuramoylalanine--D-glutamate ligase [Dethiosulfatibacter aminovorans DSM 17477]
MTKGKILIYGLGISGISALKRLKADGIKADIVDRKTREELKPILVDIGMSDMKIYSTDDSLDMSQYAVVIKSPGIPNDDPVLDAARNSNVEIINDVEYAYRNCDGSFIIGITGTNGKTTTTTIIGEMINQWKGNAVVTGNIGSGIMWDFKDMGSEDIGVVELSSFQLDGVVEFRPNISVITNISPDHISWHKTYENYIEAKLKITANQTEDDYCIINYDNEISKSGVEDVKCKKLYFTTTDEEVEGIYVNQGRIVLNIVEPEYVCDTDQIFIPGLHNLENCLAAILASRLAGADIESIRTVLESFRGVEHRLEYVADVEGISFYNDSKGTNTDASIKAINSFESPVHIILGGMDKGEEFKLLVENLKGNVKTASIFGETKHKIAETMKENGFLDYEIYDTLKECVMSSYNKAAHGEIVLLSPACASWDMYDNYMVRGREFKSIVFDLVDKNGE